MTEVKTNKAEVTAQAPVLPIRDNQEHMDPEGDHVTKSDTTAGALNSDAPRKQPAKHSVKKLQLFGEMLSLERSYSKVIEERQIELHARNLSVRQTATASVSVMLVLMTLGTAFVKHQVGVPISQALLFSVYTVTSAGFGNVKIPYDESPALLTFSVCYVYLGISALAILVAQCLQYFITLIVRVQHNTQKLSLVLEGYALLRAIAHDPLSPKDGPVAFVRGQLVQELGKTKSHLVKDVGPTKKVVYNLFTRCKKFAIQKRVVIPSLLTFLILLGTVVMMILEGWNFSEALYFSTFAMTTVGYGDIFPTKASSTWFVIFWLPFNVLFLALYLSSIASLYLQLHDWNVHRLEKSIQEKVAVDASIPAQAHSISGDSEDHDLENQQLVKSIASSGDEGSDNGSVRSLFNSSGRSDSLLNIVIRKEAKTRTRQLSHLSFGKDGVRVEDNHMDAIMTVRELLEYLQCTLPVGVGTTTLADATDTKASPPRDIPAIKLHFQVLHRLAMFIAHELSGMKTSMEVNRDTVSITIPTLKTIADNYLIPYRARDAFRSIVLESLIVLGEKDLLSHGLESFLDLHPIQFDALFRPFAVALDDDDTMNAWLASTVVLEDRCHKEKESLFPICSSLISDELKNPIEDFFPVNAGNVIRMQL